jgi:hypothetical protein
MILMAVVRTYDAEQYQVAIGKSVLSPIVISLLNFGLNDALLHLVPSARGASGIPFFPMSDGLHHFALTLMTHHGRVGVAHRLLDLAKAGLMLPNFNLHSVSFETNSEEIGVEMLDRFEHERLQALETANPDTALGESFDEIAVKLDLRMNTNIWRDHYIQYDSTPLLDDAFEQRATEQMCAAPDFGSIHNQADFVEFTGSHYNQVATCLRGLHLKHLAFCREYLQKFPYQRPDNILTIWTTKDELTESISLRLVLPKKVVRRCLDVLALTPANCTQHLGRMTAAVPSLIEAGREIWIRPLSSGLELQSTFAAIELKRCYSVAWSRNVNLREGTFQRELNSLFRDSRYVTLEGQKRIKKSGNLLTDIDGVVLDQESGTLALFQLKWQEVFGWDEKERRSRAKNFNEECEKWTRITEAFIAEKTPADMAQSLGIPKRQAKNCKQIKLFAIGRFAARFSGAPGCFPHTLALSTWAQFASVRRERLAAGTAADELTEIHDVLRSERGRSANLIPIPFTFDAGGYTITTNTLFFRAGVAEAA